MNFAGAKAKQYLFLAAMLVIVAVVYYLKPPLQFQTVGPNKEVADYSLHDRKFIIEKELQDGSGQYTIYTIKRIVEGKEPRVVGEFTTCGRYRIQNTRIFFYEPKEFHCRWLTSWMDDFFSPKISAIEFTATQENIYRNVQR